MYDREKDARPPGEQLPSSLIHDHGLGKPLVKAPMYPFFTGGTIQSQATRFKEVSPCY